MMANKSKWSESKRSYEPFRLINILNMIYIFVLNIEMVEAMFIECNHNILFKKDERIAAKSINGLSVAQIRNRTAICNLVTYLRGILNYSIT